MEVTKHSPGTFCWADLATTDAGAAKSFYTQVFGWTAHDMPAGPAGVYTMLSKNGKNVCALYLMSEEMREQQVPAHWLCYATIENADAAVAKVKELGGTVHQEPFDVMDAGRMAVVQDPTGAIFAFWEPKQHIGAEIINEPDSLCWFELQTKDVAAAEKFYTQLFGWSIKVNSGAVGEEYYEFNQGDRQAGGMMQIQKEWGEVPSNWAVYFSVGDINATIQNATSLGSTICMEPTDIEDVGRIAFLSDPQGAVFAVVQLLPGA